VIAMRQPATSQTETDMTADTINRRTALAMTALAAGIPILGAHPASAEAPNSKSTGKPAKAKKLAIILFDRFETLDVFGPVEMWGRLKDYEVVTVCQHGGLVASSQGIETRCRYSFADSPQFEIIMIPGGGGTRTEVDNPAMLDFLRNQDRATEWTTSVCTGSAVLARAGILDGRKATTNKKAYAWATGQSQAVQWQGRARWVVDGKYITSSGVSAGTDMALGLVEKIYGRAEAVRIAEGAEYIWNSDPDNDPFAVKNAR